MGNTKFEWTEKSIHNSLKESTTREKLDGNLQEIIKRDESNRANLSKPHKDIAEMQLSEITRKLKDLEVEIEGFVGLPKDKRQQGYRRMSEMCVKYSIALDRVNVLGRAEERLQRKEMLMKIDVLSTKLVDAYGEEIDPSNI